MRPRLKLSLAPAFWEMDSIKEFQPICRELLSQEVGISSAEVYGVSGQKQYGIDILARNQNNQPYAVGQCKCYQTFTQKDIANAASEFLTHFDCWYRQGVRKFILFVACDLDTTQQQNEIIQQTQQFLDKGMSFEVWSGSTLRDRLAPHPDIVNRHIHSQEILNNICGPAAQPVVFSSNNLNTILTELRRALKDPDRYHQDIEELLIQEARTLHDQIINPVSHYGWTIKSHDQTICLEYLNHLGAISERLIRIILALIKGDRQGQFHREIVDAIGVLAQETRPLSTGFTPGIPEVRLYPLVLVTFAIFIIGVERRCYSLVKQITEIPFRSNSSKQNRLTLMTAIDLIWDYEPHRFFEIAKPNNIASIPTVIQEHLLPYLNDFLIYPSDSFWKGEFILSLVYLQANQQYIWTGLFLYSDEAVNVLEKFVKPENLPGELFSKIDSLLSEFDQISREIANHAPFGRAYGFHSIAHHVYLNSQ